jgi:probable O-glycosylation ligase (exosortase A-associated)
MRDILVAILVFGSLPFILRRPWFGIIVWTWLGFMNPHRLAWGFMQEMPVALIVALTTLVGMLMSKEPKKIPWTRESVVLALFTAWMVITTLFALYPQYAWLQLDKVAKIMFMIFVAMMLITNRYRLHVLVWTIVVSLGFYGIKGGIFTILHGGVHRIYGPPGTFIADNNSMGLALAMTIPLMYYLYRESKRYYVRWALAVAMLLNSLAAFGTQSRGALLGMGAMAVMLWWKSRQKFTMAMLLALGTAMVFVFMPQEWWDRMATIRSYQEDGSAQSRIAAWTFAYNLATSRFLGGGFETFIGNTDAHSIYFEVLGEHGFVGLALFLLLGAFTWMSAARIRRRTEGSEDMDWMATLARMTQVSIVAYATAGAFLGMAYFDFAYNLVLIVIVCKSILAARQGELQQVTTAGPRLPPRREARAAVAAGHRRPSVA